MDTVDGYRDKIAALRTCEYPHLAESTYLDHAGMTLFCKSLLSESTERLLSGIMGNPHSQSLSSQRSERLIQTVRFKVLEIFDADPAVFDVVFTQNSTAAIKLLQQGMCDTFGDFSYAYHAHCHTSAVGVREHASKHVCWTDPTDARGFDLVCWTGQSNLSGERFPIEWSEEFDGYTLFDASALCTTCPPLLSGSAPDFMCLSFYKMFGMPDLGALIFKKAKAAECFRGRKYFGGGTTEVITSSFHAKKPILFEALHDGTLPIHSLVQLDAAIDVHKKLYGSFKNITNYVRWLTEYAIGKMERLPVRIFRTKGQGPIIAFTLHQEGEPLGYYDFEKFAGSRNISVRTGTVCNPGGALMWLDRTEDEILSDFKKGHKCGDDMDVIDGKPTGVVRASFGAMSSVEDVDKLVECIQDFIVDSATQKRAASSREIHIKQLTIYPIKSCHGYDIPAGTPWNVLPSGLEYDRKFCLIGLGDNKPLALKHHTNMVYMRPTINTRTGIMTIENQFGQRIKVDMNSKDLQTLESADGRRYDCFMDSALKDFLSLSVETPCVLGTSVSAMHNKSAFLLLTQASLNSIGSSDNEESDSERTLVLAPRFRANILVDGPGLVPYEEDYWSKIVVGDDGLVIDTMERCDRCHMITIDSNTGVRDPTLYAILSKERKEKGKVYFGSNMNLDGQCYDRVYQIKTGDRVFVHRF